MPWHCKTMKDVVYCDKFRWYTAISFGELYASFDPKISEWGNLTLRVLLYTEYIGIKSEPGELKHLSNQRKRNQLRLRE